jgi:glycosyltransferase involved in cell wall biosynthesis
VTKKPEMQTGYTMDPQESDREVTGGAETIAVVIPALNEGKNIGDLLDDVFSQELVDSLSLQKVIVISDGSTDETEEVVRKRIPLEPRLELRINPKRLGKAACINIGTSSLESDFLVLVDGDVRLYGPHTFKNLLENLDDDVGMVGGIPVPVKEISGLAPMVFMCGDILRDYIRSRLNEGNNIYSAHGRILALSRELYAALEIPRIEGGKVLSTDQFLYYACVKSGMRFVLRETAQVLFILPESFKDYLRQTVRFMYSASNTKYFFDDVRFANQFYVPLEVKVGAMLHLFRRKPFGALAWLAYRFVARSMYLAKRYLLKKEVAATWEVAESTKDAVRES